MTHSAKGKNSNYLLIDQLWENKKIAESFDRHEQQQAEKQEPVDDAPLELKSSRKMKVKIGKVEKLKFEDISEKPPITLDDLRPGMWVRYQNSVGLMDIGIIEAIDILDWGKCVFINGLWYRIFSIAEILPEEPAKEKDEYAELKCSNCEEHTLCDDEYKKECDYINKKPIQPETRIVFDPERECPDCVGKGKRIFIEDHPTQKKALVLEEYDCKTCHGTGKLGDAPEVKKAVQRKLFALGMSGQAKERLLRIPEAVHGRSYSRN